MNTPTSVPHYDHVVVVVEENHTPAEIQANAPYIDSLASGGALLTNYSAVSHPSEPNYFAMFAGDTKGISDDGTYDFSGTPTLVTSLQAAGKTFTGYVESGSPQKHNPWESFGQSSVEMGMSNFPTDFSKLSAVSFVIPNLNDDMHDGSVAQGDAWLQRNIGAYADWAKANNSLLVVTTDEDDGSGNNNVLTTLDGAHIVPGTYSEHANHYSLLNTIAGAVGVSAPGNAANATPLSGMFDTGSTPSAIAAPPVTTPSVTTPPVTTQPAAASPIGNGPN